MEIYFQNGILFGSKPYFIPKTDTILKILTQIFCWKVIQFISEKLA